MVSDNTKENENKAKENNDDFCANHSTQTDKELAAQILKMMFSRRQE